MSISTSSGTASTIADTRSRASWSASRSPAGKLRYRPWSSRAVLISPHHLGGVAVGDRGDPHRHVLQQLDVDPAQAEDEKWTEGRVLGHADQYLVAPGTISWTRTPSGSPTTLMR